MYMYHHFNGHDILCLIGAGFKSNETEPKVKDNPDASFDISA